MHKEPDVEKKKSRTQTAALATHFDSCDKSSGHSLFKLDHWGVQRQHFNNLPGPK